jgi:hypothetical protein
MALVVFCQDLPPTDKGLAEALDMLGGEVTISAHDISPSGDSIVLPHIIFLTASGNEGFHARIFKKPRICHSATTMLVCWLASTTKEI